MNDEQLHKDAERYRWLRSQARLEHRDGGNSGQWDIRGIQAYENWIGHEFNYKTFDGAVDAAMKGKNA